MDLNTAWFIIVCTLFTGYAVLDGFDLGAGPLLLLTKGDRDRRIILNAIGPIWNGNEVWLVTGGGALFAAFPNAYATIFSGFYDAFMPLLAALIFRAGAIEFRGQHPGPRWRAMWDFLFAASSVLSALLLGAAVGNLAWGIPLDANHEFIGTFFTLLRPYPLCVGLTTVALFVMHANLYLIMKSPGELEQQLIRWTRITVPLYIACFIVMNTVTILTCPHIRAAIAARPVLLSCAFIASIAVTLNILRQIRKGNEGWAFISSALSIITLMFLFGAAIYPCIVISTPDIANSLDIYNASSTNKSLDFMLVVAAIGVPLVLTYTVAIYRVFRGKVVLNDHSY